MKIIDCFPYFNEKELLELRIKLLYNKVDKFIITDANKTHKGDSKEFTCKNTLVELGLYPDEKIEIVEVNLPSFEEEPNAWVRERMQRNLAVNYIPQDSYCIISDCDEIINPEFIDYYINIARNNPNNILRIPMVFLNGRADLRVYNNKNEPVEWCAGFICNYEQLKKYSLSEIRESYSLKKRNIEYEDIFAVDNGIVEDAGWHFSWMGDNCRIKEKVSSFLHWDEVQLKENYKLEENGSDILGRNDHILKKHSFFKYPPLIFELENIRKFLFPHFRVFPITFNSNFGENWFSYPNLYSSMVKKFNSGSKFVEVGSWKGMSSAFMATEIANSEKDISFCCIDSWEGSIEHREFKDLKDIYHIFITNMRPLEKYFSHIKERSLNAVNLFEDNSLDFVFIDASHEYEDVKNDILAWLPKVKRGGILAGHDYYVNQDWFSGVKKAVNEIFSDFETSEDCFIVNVK